MDTISDIKGSFTLHNGVKMPYLGLGVWQTEDGEEVINSVKWALQTGYRHIDTASIYQNEKGVGRGIRESGVPREEVFLVSKVWNTDQGYESTLKAFERSINKLDTDYLDLYLIHWPTRGKYKDTWKALETLYRENRVKAIGVSNFLKHHLEDLLGSASVVPMVNQMEFHPYLVQQDLLDYCLDREIQYEAWSPLMKGHLFDVEAVKEIADRYGKTMAQVVLRWDLQKGVVTIPKSSNKDRIIENAGIFDFELLDEDVERISNLDIKRRFGPHPRAMDFPPLIRKAWNFYIRQLNK